MTYVSIPLIGELSFLRNQNNGKMPSTTCVNPLNRGTIISTCPSETGSTKWFQRLFLHVYFYSLLFSAPFYPVFDLN